MVRAVSTVASFMALAAHVSAAVLHNTKAKTTTSNCNVLSLTRMTTPPVRRHKHRYGDANVTMIQAPYGQAFLTDITFGDNVYQVIVDTGSSDTWLIETNFNCSAVSPYWPIPESQCQFGPTYNESKTISRIDNESFHIRYGSGESLNGYMAYEDVQLAGIKVRQEVAIVDFAAWQGDGISSGLLGLGLPGLTSAHAGMDYDLDYKNNSIHYSPIMATMANKHLMNPMFSLALNRGPNGDGGYLALGELPPVAFEHDFAKAPMLPILTDRSNQSTFQYYTLNVDGLVYKGVENVNYTSTVANSSTSTLQMFVDSDTPWNCLPDVHANAINALFDPPAVYNSTLDNYVTKCNATTPKVGFRIGKKVFYTDPRDMLLPMNDGSDNCISGMSGDGDGLGVLGDVFLHGVVAVFDLQKLEMRFANRKAY